MNECQKFNLIGSIMFKLKLNCPFCGYGHIVGIVSFIISFFASMIIALYNITADDKYDSFQLFLDILESVFVFGISMSIVLFICYKWLNRITAKDKEYMESAKSPYWRAITKGEINAAIYKQKADKVMIFFVLLYAVAFIVISALTGASGNFILVTTLILLTISAVYIICQYVKQYRWSKLDETAMCAEINVQRTYMVEFRGKGRVTKNCYCVLYTPEDKYILESYASNGANIHVIKFNNMITFIDDFELINFKSNGENFDE